MAKIIHLGIIIVLFFGIISALPLDQDATILEYKNDNDGLGNFEYSFRTSNGIAREERGYTKNLGDPNNEILVIEGSYSYIGTDGKLYDVYYIADENGYRVVSPHKNEPPVGLLSFSPAAPGSKLSPELSADLIGSLIG